MERDRSCNGIPIPSVKVESQSEEEDEGEEEEGSIGSRWFD